MGDNDRGARGRYGQPAVPRVGAQAGGEPRAAVFDVDGTLVDTNYLHAVTWWEAFRQAGHTVPMREIHRAIGMASDLLIPHLLGEDRDTSQDDRMDCAHRALYATYFPRLAALPGAGDLLRTVAGRGWQVVLASSASPEELSAMREALDAEDVIAEATSSGAVESGKPAPDLVEVALRQAGAPPEQAVFVGDTVWDIQASAKAGVPCVALLAGGIPRADLEEAGAVAVYRDPADLLAHLDTSPLAD